MNKFNCQHCNNPYDEPKMLPCGFTICNVCIQTFLIDNGKTSNKYECLMCKEVHQFSNDKTFPINQHIAQMINAVKYDLDESTRSTMKNVLTQKNELEHLVMRGEDFVKEYCLEKINRVDLASEQMIEKVQQTRNELIDEIKLYEKKTIEHIVEEQTGIEKLGLEKLYKNINELDQSIAQCTNKDALVIFNDLKEQLTKKRGEFENILFNNNFVEFKNFKFCQVASLSYSSINNIRVSKDANYFLDFTELEEISLNLNEKIEKIHPFQILDVKEIELLDNGYFGIIFTNSGNQNSYIALLNSDLEYVLSFKIKLDGGFCFVKDKFNALYLVSNTILYRVNHNFDFKEISIENGYYLKNVSVNENYILCLMTNSKINIYNMNLQSISSFNFNRYDANSAFYIPARAGIDQLEMIGGERYIVKYHLCEEKKVNKVIGSDSLAFLDKHGSMLHEEKINGENIAIFHTSSQIIVINTKELTYLDMNGNFIKRVELSHVPKDIKMKFDRLGNPVFFDLKKTLLYRKKNKV